MPPLSPNASPYDDQSPIATADETNTSLRDKIMSTGDLVNTVAVLAQLCERVELLEARVASLEGA